MIDMPSPPQRGEDDGSTFTCSNSVGKSPSFVVGEETSHHRDDSSSHSAETVPKPNLPQHETLNETPSHWCSEYEEAEHEEFLAFCLLGFLTDYTAPEEEVLFEESKKENKKKKAKTPNSVGKSDVDKGEESTKTEKKKKARTKSSKPKKSKSLPAQPSRRKSVKLAKKKPTRKRSVRSKKAEDEQQQQQVDVIPPELVRKESMVSQTESSSDAASFFDDESEIGSLCPLPPKVDEEAERLKLKISLIQAAADAASLGRLTRLHEKVVESIAEEEPVVNTALDTWQLKTCAAETDSTLDRSVHQQVLQEAAALGRMKRVKTGPPRRSMSLQGWSEQGEELSSPKRQQSLDSATIHGGGARFKRRAKNDMLLSSHERMDHFVSETRTNKKTTMYDPEHVLEKQHQDHANFSRLVAGDMDWLPTTIVPAFVAPRSYLSSKRIRSCVVNEVAKACAVRNHRLQCNFRLNITRKCACPYCKAPSALQTYAYQQLEKEQPKSENPTRFNSAPTKLLISNVTSDPSELYSRSILRTAETPSSGPSPAKAPKRTPSWASPTLKKAEQIKREDVLEEETPIWAMVTGDRDTNDIPEWASPALRELVAAQSANTSAPYD